MKPISDMTNQWRRSQCTTGTQQLRYHAHSYYDIGVFDSTSRYVLAHEMTFSERPPTASDIVRVGITDTEKDANWRAIGETSAWSWQQGPMAQWVSDTRLVLWNDRDGTDFVTRVHDLGTGQTDTLPRSSYAVDPKGGFTLSVNMARLDILRPGYGYVGGANAQLSQRHPANDGVWLQSLSGDSSMLILSLDRAVDFLWSQLPWRSSVCHWLREFHYWFNHVKISPNGDRFTVKLRYKNLDSGWNNEQGVSLTCNIDGSGLRLLAEATSHVIWLDGSSLYFWQRNGFYLFTDMAPEGQRLRQIGPGLIDKNAHLRYLPGSGSTFVYDTPYREAVDLFMHDEDTTSTQRIARFIHHRPANGPYRCDLHPCPSPNGRKIIVSSLEDGGRQVYLLQRDSDQA